ncbi:hypothetical protein [Citrobacter farmeri]|uniref:hypothetical protein n=1 Tax=Citrobacter farmeri TaxID=67824 RepID=UPI0023EED2E5|nr:hypothetical protein [Citrobacter farmeri]
MNIIIPSKRQKIIADGFSIKDFLMLKIKHKAKIKPISPERALRISRKNKVISAIAILKGFDILLSDNMHITVKARLSLTIWYTPMNEGSISCEKSILNVPGLKYKMVMTAKAPYISNNEYKPIGFMKKAQPFLKIK